MKYGYNLYSAFSVTEDRESLISTMHELKRMGYDGVEFFLYFDIPAEEMKAICEEIGLIPFSSHPRLFHFFQNLDEETDYAQKAGIETLVMPHVAQDERNGAYYQTVLAAIPGWKKKCDAAGIKLAWHNHDFEFQPFEGRRYLMDAILEVDPGIHYEIDTFWTTYAGVDTLALMDQYKDRIEYVHFKDYAGKTGPGYLDFDFCAVGEGLVDVKSIAKKAAAIGAQWAVVEQDLHKKPVLEDAESSLICLKRLLEGESG